MLINYHCFQRTQSQSIKALTGQIETRREPHHVEDKNCCSPWAWGLGLARTTVKLSLAPAALSLAQIKEVQHDRIQQTQKNLPNQKDLPNQRNLPNQKKQNPKKSHQKKSGNANQTQNQNHRNHEIRLKLKIQSFVKRVY